MRLSLPNIGKLGVIKDPTDWQLAPGAWTRAENVRFRENAAWKMFGYTQVAEPPLTAPHFMMNVNQPGNRWWIYGGLHKVYVMNGAQHFNITRTAGDYNMIQDQRWNGSILETVPILNNPSDIPQYWSPVNSGQRLRNLTNWPTTLRAQVVRSFKQYLIALGISKSGVSYPTTVKWSHPAEPGQVPPSWDETDETNDAGEWPLNTTGDPLVDCLPLGSVNVVYKEESCHSMSHVGGIFIFKFDKLFDEGMLTQRCAVEVKKRHFVVTQNDIVLHDGNSMQSLLEQRLRRYVFNDLDSDRYRQSFVVNYREAGEVWFCYPSISRDLHSDYPNRALIWNVADNSFGFRDIPGVREGESGRIDAAPFDSWDGDDEIWDEDTTIWDEQYFQNLPRSILLPQPEREDLLAIDKTRQNAGEDFTAVLERTSMTFPVGEDVSSLVNNPQAVKQITRLYPMMDATEGAEIYFQFGTASTPKEAVTWDPDIKVFHPGVDRTVDKMIAGHLLSLRIYSTDNSWWRLTGLDVDVNVVGAF